MSKSALNEAISALRIANVYMRDLHVEVSEEFDILLEGEELEVRYRLSPRSSALIEYGNHEVDELSRIFRVDVEGEVGLIPPQPTCIDANEVREARIRISAKFRADYTITSASPPRQEALDEFALKNAGYHIWPYWRELVQTVCSRLQLPPLVLPMYQLNGESSKLKR